MISANMRSLDLSNWYRNSCAAGPVQGVASHSGLRSALVLVLGLTWICGLGCERGGPNGPENWKPDREAAGAGRPAAAQERLNRPANSPRDDSERAAVASAPPNEIDASWVRVTNSIGMELVAVPPGEFLMGSLPENPYAGYDEQPQHRVVIPHGLLVGRFEVTQAEYERIMGTNPSYFREGGAGGVLVDGMETGRLPVEQVPWYEAVAFCQKLSELPDERAAGRVYRLPTEAEWEYVCRAGSGTNWSFGSDAWRLGDYAWSSGNAADRTHRVGRKSPNPFGVHDMHGNVWEWCSDWYFDRYYRESPVDNPTGPPSGFARVVRGGGWLLGAENCRSAARDRGDPSGRYGIIGFRVVCPSDDSNSTP